MACDRWRGDPRARASALRARYSLTPPCEDIPRPEFPAVGDLWLDVATNTVFLFNGDDWKPVV